VLYGHLALCLPPKKSLLVSRSFGRAITTLQEIREAVATYTSRAAEKLRRERLAASMLTVFLLTNRFQENEPQYHNEIRLPLAVATQNTAELLTHALRGIELIFREGYHDKKAGVMLTGLVPAHRVQTHLFDTKDRERSARLMTVIDHINTQMGSGTMRYAAVGLKPPWLMRSARRSPQYTTQWRALVQVRAV
jgi:DNA polymerase V